MQKETLKKRAAVGAVTLGVKRVVIQVVYTVSNIFLARLLFPADFGNFAIVTFVAIFFSVFTDLGLGPALIQKKEKLETSDLQTAFTVQILLNTIIVLIIYLSAPVISSFYNLGDTGTWLFRIYSFIFLLSPFKTSSGAKLERNLEYQRLVIIELLEVALTVTTTVMLAFLGFGVLSFAIGAVAGHLLGAILYFSFSPWPIRLLINLKNLLSLTKFGLPFQSSVFLGLFYGPAILLYLGKVVGTQNLGFYQFAASLSVLPLAVPEIVNRIVFPLGARTSEDKKFFQQIVATSITIVSATSLPVVFIMTAVAPQLVHLLYTDRWMPALPALYLGLVQMGVISFTSIFSQALLARGLSTVMRDISIVWTVLTWILAPPLIYFFNFVGMSLTGLAVSATGIWLIFRLGREVNFSFFQNFAPYFTAAIASGFTAFILINLLPQNFANLVLVLIFAFGVYTGLILLFMRKTLFENFYSIISVFRQTQ